MPQYLHEKKFHAFNVTLGIVLNLDNIFCVRKKSLRKYITM